ncbi:MAG: hypothetical protein RIS54_428 [Verrucomicrobiota bacterium]|jgi:hypothetical protein
MRVRFYQYRLLLVSGGILLAGLAAGRWGYVQERNRLPGALVRDAERVATILDAEDLEKLSGTPADARQEQKERVLEAGANDYLLKPVRLKDMDSMMRRFMAQRGPAGS